VRRPDRRRRILPADALSVRWRIALRTSKCLSCGLVTFCAQDEARPIYMVTS
jgi:hypothetical protein